MYLSIVLYLKMKKEKRTKAKRELEGEGGNLPNCDPTCLGPEKAGAEAGARGSAQARKSGAARWIVISFHNGDK